MRAAEVASLSGVGALNIVEKPVPEPKPGQVRFRVKAAGVNFADILQARGQYGGGPKAPFIAGIEAAGEVVATGPDTELAVGDRVMGYGAKSFADYVCWPESNLLPIPEAWSFEQAASFPIVWLSAHGCLRVVGQLEAGDTVLVHAAAGGVGTAAVRLAKHFGARVIATASTDAKLELAKSHGADDLINYEREDFAGRVKELTDGEGADIILESVGGKVFEDNFRAVKPYGRIVVFGVASTRQAMIDNNTLVFKPVHVSGYHLAVMANRRPDLMGPALAEVMQLVEAGAVTPETPKTYSLSDTRKALEDLEARRTTGKLVVVP